MHVSVKTIKQLRSQHSFSQELLAKTSGLSLRTIQRIEKEGKASTESVLSLAATFDVSPKQLMSEPDHVAAIWKWRSFMQRSIALVIVITAVILLTLLAGQIKYYLDWVGFVFLIAYVYSLTIVSFGIDGVFRSLSGLGLIFSSETKANKSSDYLAYVYRKQITFAYSGSALAILIGMVAIHNSNEAITSNLVFHQSYAVCILVGVYGVVLSELIFRPLALKLESQNLVPFDEH